ncbi:MAG: DUF805 domain-containing protein [Candidatus Thiodiazotropha sp.]
MPLKKTVLVKPAGRAKKIMWIRKLSSPNGRATRKEFLIGSVFIYAFWIIVGFLIIYVFDLASHAYYFELKLLIDIVALLSITPLMAQRLHDMNLPSVLVAIYWALIPLSIRNIIFWQHKYGVEVQLNNPWLTALYVAALLLIILMYLKPSYRKTNKWGSPNNNFNSDRHRHCAPQSPD